MFLLVLLVFWALQGSSLLERSELDPGEHHANVLSFDSGFSRRSLLFQLWGEKPRLAELYRGWDELFNLIQSKIINK